VEWPARDERSRQVVFGAPGSPLGFQLALLHKAGKVTVNSLPGQSQGCREPRA